MDTRVLFSTGGQPCDWLLQWIFYLKFLIFLLCNSASLRRQLQHKRVSADKIF